MTGAGRARPVPEGVAAGLLAAAAAALVATELARRDIVAPTAVAATADAWLVHHGAPGGFGADTPPGLSVLTLVHSALGATVLLPGMLLGAAIPAFVHGVLAQQGLRPLLRWLATGTLVLNPAWLYVTSTGVATAGGALAVLVAGHGTVRWLRARSLPWLLAASTALAAGAVTWYPALAWSCAAIVLLGAALRLAPHPHPQASGVLIVFALPIAFAAAAWTLLAWSRTGALPAWLSPPAPDNLVPASAAAAIAALAPLAVALRAGAVAPRDPRLLAAATGTATAVATGVLAGAAGAVLTVGLVLLPAVALIVAGSTLGHGRAPAWIAVCGAILVANAVLALSLRNDAGQPVAHAFAVALTGEHTGSVPPSAVRVGHWLARFSAPGEVSAAGLDRRTRSVVAHAAGMPGLAAAAGPRPLHIVDAGQPTGDGRWRPFSADGLAVEAARDWP